MLQRLLCFVLLGGLVLVLSACNVLMARKDVQEIQQATIITGNIVGSAQTDGLHASPIVVSAYRSGFDGPEVAHYAVLHEPGSYELLVAKGSYGVFAFEDANRNLVFDQGEAFAYYANGARLTAEAGGLITSVDLALQRGDLPPGFKSGFAFTPKPVAPFHSSLAGALADLDSEAFSANYGEKGYWHGVEFFRELGGNVYFTEPYDPKRIPVLFVHGAAGSPQDWRYFISQLDKSRYQAWIYFYPSAAAMEPMTTLLAKKLWDLQAKYHFAHLHVVAHSAGGLVVRNFLGRFGTLYPSIASFVSISTPWGGEAFAELGVKHSPVVIPSWEDMQPNSSFNRQLFARKTPDSIKHYMLFGYRGGLTLLRPNNDGAVTLASQLDHRAQAGAAGVFGFDEDHNSILRSKDVFAKLSALLASNDPPGFADTLETGDLLVRIEDSLPKGAVRSAFVLVLEREGQKPQFIPMESGVRESRIEALPVGRYRLQVRSLVLRAEQGTQTVDIGHDTQSMLKLSLVPSGGFCGYATDAMAGIGQAGAMRPVLSDIHFTDVSVYSGHVARTTPEKIAKPESYGFDRDALADGSFCFVDLEPGTYTVHVEAEGYEPHTGTRLVELGGIGQAYYVPLRKRP